MSGNANPPVRRATIAPTSSYASVLSGQSRIPATSTTESTQMGVPASGRTSGSAPKQQSSVTTLQTLPQYLLGSAYAELLSQHAKAEQAKIPTFIEEVLPSLPTKWNDSDKCIGIELLHDGSEVKFIGPKAVTENEAAAVRADHYMPPQCGVFYFEVKIISKGKDSLIGIGFCAQKVSMSRLPGWEPESWGYHGDDGNSFCCHGPGKNYGPQFAANDTIGCGVNFRTNTAFFTKNGVHLGTAFRDIKTSKLFPAVGMKKLGEHIRVNFGQSDFLFDIESYMMEEKELVYRDINQFPTANLQPPFDESALIQAFVASYLAHDGYVDTAKAFAEDVQKEARALATSGRRGSIRPLDIKEDTDAINRQRIRTAILEGDVDRALKLTNAFYPKVFEENEMTYFRLKCRKLVEMIGVVSEASTNSMAYIHHSNTKHVSDDVMEDDVFSGDMEIDDQSANAGEWDRMDVEDDRDGMSQVKGPLDAAVQYAQQLRIEFQADQRPEIRKALEESFSLVAYQDPKNSTLSHLFDEDGRIAVAEELNSAILVSLGKSSVAPLERLVQQTTALAQELSEDGGPAAFINVHKDILKGFTF